RAGACRRARARAESDSVVGAPRSQRPPAVPGGAAESGGGQEADAEGDQQDLTHRAVGGGIVAGDGVQQPHDRAVVAHGGGLRRGRGCLRRGAGDLRLLLLVRFVLRGGLDERCGALLRGSLLRSLLLDGSLLSGLGLGLGLHLHGGCGLLLDRGSGRLLGHVLLGAILRLRLRGRLFGLLRLRLRSRRRLLGPLRGRRRLVAGRRAVGAVVGALFVVVPVTAAGALVAAVVV